MGPMKTVMVERTRRPATSGGKRRVVYKEYRMVVGRGTRERCPPTFAPKWLIGVRLGLCAGFSSTAEELRALALPP